MSSVSKRGRPTRPYKTSWGEEVHGLYRGPDGRYRINATGKKFTEHDERLAVKKFRQWQEQNGQAPNKMMRLEYIPTPATRPADIAKAMKDFESKHATFTVGEGLPSLSYVAEIEDKLYWHTLREMLLNQPEIVAQKTGIPELANLRHMALPRPSLKIDELITAYERGSTARLPNSQRSAIIMLQRMAAFCDARTLDDLTTERLLAFKNSVENDPALESGATKRAYFARCKTIIAFGLKVGLDAGQIQAALGRMKVLWSRERESPDDPRPISPEDFHRLLNGAIGKWEGWRPWLMLGLNLCLHLKDVCMLKWSSFDLTAGTYGAVRRKTESKRIPQVGLLWPETILEMKKLTPVGPYVLNSGHGTHYHRNARGNAFLEFKTALGMPEIQFDHLRDGAYTAAVQAPGVDEKFARVMAGHKSPGLQDKYVLRNPQIVRPAVEAVYQKYMGSAITPSP